MRVTNKWGLPASYLLNLYTRLSLDQTNTFLPFAHCIWWMNVSQWRFALVFETKQNKKHKLTAGYQYNIWADLMSATFHDHWNLFISNISTCLRPAQPTNDFRAMHLLNCYMLYAHQVAHKLPPIRINKWKHLAEKFVWAGRKYIQSVLFFLLQLQYFYSTWKPRKKAATMALKKKCFPKKDHKTLDDPAIVK